MKNLKIWSLIALFAMVLAGCSDDNTDDGPANQVDIYGKWHLVEFCESAPVFDVYVEFTKSGKFNLYQQVWKFTYEHFTGNYTVDGNVVNGTYSDGSQWLASYKASVVDNVLILTNKDEVAKYEACKIPSEVITEATTPVRSESVVPFL